MDEKLPLAENMSLLKIANFPKKWGITRGSNFYNFQILSTFLSVVLIQNPYYNSAAELGITSS